MPSPERVIFGDFLGSERKKVGGRSACQRHGGRCPTDHHHPTHRHLRRNAAIVLTCAGERTIFTVSQKQKDALLLSSDKVELDATTDVAWITQAPGTRGLVEKNLCFDIAPNEGTKARQGTITLSGGGVTQAITVRQEAYEEPELVRVEYRTGYTWEEAHDNLPLLYYATVYRDRYYSNGDIITDTFVDTGHMVELSALFSPGGSNSKEFSNGHIMKWTGNTTYTQNDSVLIMISSTQVTDLSRIATQVEQNEYVSNIGEWDNYSISKLYGSGEFISAADIATTGNWGSCNQQIGWYFRDIGYMREIELDYDDGIRVIHGVRSYRMTLTFYDQYLSIDGRRIDFLKYQPEYHFDFSTENTGGSIVHTFECRFEFMGRNFYTALINTITQL